ncbi:methylated-DNA--[protein]-cysteine S-methyltransferase [Photobacterium sp. 1_MG-2023]|uniref:methylated-DNA--[protein]-cysteine S-methyltransferase n=1 Tax=Photobacterium sp. 1_MG-2023 TaxID=3062646 RepID=UPI0026E2A4AE|nr:methylated-DNA--[protein]-cysteine S-methyltransferase [Photobacterium sp. 1_MG-2023]MDO6706605.1 methylated-DNA--[protein]-cysteine S-methyltransferase [Photobacterium sp. 1_MG-2023]
MATMYYDLIQTELGVIYLQADLQGLKLLSFASDGYQPPPCWNYHPEKMHEYTLQVKEYLCGQRQQFSLSLAPEGTPFQRSVWQAIQHIPYGKTATYHSLAVQLGNKKAQQAIALAKNVNPIPLVIPCHRVICDHPRLSCRFGLDLINRLRHLESGQIQPELLPL